MRKEVSIVILLSFLFVSGCNSALLKTMNENEESEKRIAEKSSQLLSLEEQNHHLSNEKKNLASELDQKSMTLTELKSRLEKLKRENRKIQTTTAAEQKKKDALTKHLDQQLEGINALDADPHISTIEKEKRIEQLKQQIGEEMLKDD